MASLDAVEHGQVVAVHVPGPRQPRAVAHDLDAFDHAVRLEPRQDGRQPGRYAYAYPAPTGELRLGFPDFKARYRLTDFGVGRFPRRD